jgi:putative membrane-bound dehydrogenase-like protein
LRQELLRYANDDETREVILRGTPAEIRAKLGREILESAKEDRAARDRVSMLEDSDGDGFLDRRTVFADGLELATSLVFYKDGVIVTQAPDILWLRDTDGDGRAETRVVLYTGWGTFDTHAVTSNLRWGPDGWVYGSVGYSAGEVRSGTTRTSFGRITAGLYRFRPDGSLLEQVAAGSCNTWGCEIAPDGEIFFSTATCGEPILHVVLPEKVVSRSGMRGVRAAKSIMEENKVFPARTETRQPYVQIDWVGAWTSAAGSTIYDGGAWPDRWNGPSWSFFLHEPTVWLSHHEFLDPQGVSYQGRREAGRQQTHFLTSTDYWFKPIHSRVGPDGALYIVDFYNQIAVHNDTRGPAHGARNAATRPDRDHHFTRLYRVQHREAKTLPAFTLDARQAGTLVEQLDHPNGWVRATANRLLSEGAGRGAMGALEGKARQGRTSYGRMQALWVMHNLGSLDPELLLGSMGDADVVVRKAAYRIAAERDNSDYTPDPQQVRQALQDPNERVRLQVLTAIATTTVDRPVAEVMVEIWPGLRDRHLQAAFLAVTAQDPMLFVNASLAARQSSALGELVPHLARQIANRNDAGLARGLVLALAGRPAAVDALKVAALQSLTAALRADVKPAADAALGTAMQKLLEAPNTAGAILPLVARWDFAGQVGEAAKAAVAREEARLADTTLGDDLRGQIALNLLGVRSVDPSIVPAVAALVGGNASSALQRRVIDALGTTGEPSVATALLGVLPRLDFELREAAIGQLLTRADWSGALVEALSAGTVPPVLMGPNNLHRLRTHADPAVARRAAAVIEELKGPEAKEKEALVASLLSEVAKPGDVALGAKLFTENCAACHKYKNEGAEFAPNLTGMGAHGAEDLLVHILDPNRVVEPNFLAVSIETKDDLSYDGIVLRENNAVVVLRNQNAEMEIRKDNIAERRVTGRSLMPEGYEQLGAAGLRNVIAYLMADDLRYRILDLSPAFTANSTRGIYNSLESRDESLRFRKWGVVLHRDIPFDIVNPARTPNGFNLVVLKGGYGLAQTFPQEVEFKVGLASHRLHFLGGVGGWAFPIGERDQPVARVTVHYREGEPEVFVLRNGVEIADYIGRHDVPGSEALENLDQLLMQGRQLRYFSRPLKGRSVIEKIVLSSYGNQVAPTFVAVTAEIGEPPATTATTATTEAAAAKPVPATPAAPQFSWGTGLKTLLVGGGTHHDFQRWFHMADVKLLNETGGITAHYTEPKAGLAEALADVDVLVLSNNQAFADEASRQAILRHVEQGRGVVGLHAGLWYNWADWPEYNRVVFGGGSRGHDRFMSFPVVVGEPGHPVMKGVPARFEIEDELYWFERDPAGTAIEVLATSASPAKGREYPQVFVVRHPRARVVGITLGHDGRAHTHPAFVQLLRNAVLWAGGQEPRVIAAQ